MRIVQLRNCNSNHMWNSIATVTYRWNDRTVLGFVVRHRCRFEWQRCVHLRRGAFAFVHVTLVQFTKIVLHFNEIMKQQKQQKRKIIYNNGVGFHCTGRWIARQLFSIFIAITVHDVIRVTAFNRKVWNDWFVTARRFDDFQFDRSISASDCCVLQEKSLPFN